VTAAEIAAALGGAQRSGAWWYCRCPAHDDRTPSLSLRDGDRGIVVHCHAGCDAHDVLAVLRRRGLIGGTSDDRGRSDMAMVRIDDRGDGEDAARRIAWARRIWDAAREAPGSPVADYLSSRSITIAPSASLRYAPFLRRPDGSRPAMVARIDNIDGELIGISRTWLACDGGTWRRLDRAMLGRAAGGAVHLAPPADTLLIGEGIETCLAATQATGQPAWAALSTSGVTALPLPTIVRTVIILADNDANRAGERAARAAARRWLAEGVKVRIAMPPEHGTDMADVLARPCLRARVGGRRCRRMTAPPPSPRLLSCGMGHSDRRGACRICFRGRRRNGR
jgi:putative DNA primase/helicase